MVDHWQKLYSHIFDGITVLLCLCIYLRDDDCTEFKTYRRAISEKWLSIIDCAVCWIKYCINFIHTLGYWIMYSSMVIDLRKRNVAFVRVMMTFIPHSVPVFCTSLYYSVFFVPYVAVLQPFSLVFSLKGVAYQPVGSDE